MQSVSQSVLRYPLQANGVKVSGELENKNFC
jgi:hypothetical protein